jgi:serine protease AprX
VSDDQGEASVLDVIYGLQFVVDNKAAYNIRVVNLSLESTTPGSYKTDPLNAAVESAWFKGIVVVTASATAAAPRTPSPRARATTRT